MYRSFSFLSVSWARHLHRCGGLLTAFRSPCLRRRRSLGRACAPAGAFQVSRAFLRVTAPGGDVTVKKQQERLKENEDEKGEARWDDASEGLREAWQEEDVCGFAAAANSAEVQQAHFGPTWSRFTTVGRLSLQKMRENQPNGGGSAAPGRVASYPSIEELHARELHTKRKLMEANFESYEEYLASTLGGDLAKGDSPGEAPLRATERGMSTVSSNKEDTKDAEENKETGLYTAAAMERAFAVVDGTDGLDRMTQRNIAREALVSLEAAEDPETVPLPKFMLIDTDDPKALAAAEADSFHPALPNASARRRDVGAGEVPQDIPLCFQVAVVAGLPGAHSDMRLPLEDPIHWDTDAILVFLERFEHLPEGDAEATRVATDADMKNTFWMVKVDGKMLLNDVTPPRLFRVMRRWHVQRMNIIREAFQSQDASTSETVEAFGDSSQSNPVGQNSPSSVVDLSDRAKDTIARLSHRLEEAVQPLNSEMIQETILLCFPYAR